LCKKNIYRLCNVKQLESVISVALKTPLEITLGIYIRHFCIDPMTIPVLVSHQAVPQHFTTKLRPCLQFWLKLDLFLHDTNW